MEGRIRPNIYDKRRGLPTDRKITTILIDKDRENDSSRLKRSKMHDTVTKMHQMSNIAGEVGGGRACWRRTAFIFSSLFKTSASFLWHRLVSFLIQNK